VFEIAFSGGSNGLARVRYNGESMSDDAHRLAFEVEATVNRLLNENTAILVPQIYKYNLSHYSPAGCPYILMEHLPRRILPNRIAKSIPREHFEKVAEQFVDILCQMQSVQRYQIGHPIDVPEPWDGSDVVGTDWHPLSASLSSSLDFFHAKTEETIKEAMRTYSNDPEWINSCWMVRFALNHFIILNRAYGPFPLCHLDLHYKNILLTMITIYPVFLAE
jgi:isoamyl acetate esterase